MEKRTSESSPAWLEIQITHRMAFLFLAGIISTAWLGYLLFFHNNADASSIYPSSQSLAVGRSFYITTNKFNGTGADGIDVCESGYHFASLWEILDVSNLEYAAGIGAGEGDIGGGPPASLAGWVRTGYSANNSSMAGKANCNAWTDTAGYGTTTELISDWTNTSTTDLPPWNVNVHSCALTQPAWCVQD